MTSEYYTKKKSVKIDTCRANRSLVYFRILWLLYTSIEVTI